MGAENILIKIKQTLRDSTLHQGKWRANTGQTSRPIVIAGMFNTANGIGQLARTCAETLIDAGHAPICIDLSASLNQADMTWDGDLVDRMPETPGTLILHLNGPETRHALRTLKLGRWSRWHIIGSWAWELEHLPTDWASAAVHLDEIWTCSDFVTQAVRNLSRVPVRTVHPRISIPNVTVNRAQFGLPSDAIICLAAADSRSSFERKNILGSVKMFQAASKNRPNTALILKTRNLALFPDFQAELQALRNKDPSIILLDKPLPEELYHSLIASIDIVLSPHRAEGFGFVIAEGMAHGKPVIATGWSGNTDFMTPDNAIALPYELVPVSDQFEIYSQLSERAFWAEPDIDFGAIKLAHLFDHPQQCLELGKAAAAHMSQHFNGASYAAALNL